MTSASEIGLPAMIARLELLQGIREVNPEVRRSYYLQLGGAASFESLEDDDVWVTVAESAYRAMAREGGWVASVGDQLMAELDVRRNASLWAEVAGLDAGPFLSAAGAWWSPSARWYYLGRRIAPGLDPEDEGQFLSIAESLLQLGAEGLATFFLMVASGAESSLGILPRRNRKARLRAKFMGQVALQRAALFRKGPTPDGRYLKESEGINEDVLGRMFFGKRQWKRLVTQVMKSEKQVAAAGRGEVSSP